MNPESVARVTWLQVAGTPCPGCRHPWRMELHTDRTFEVTAPPEQIWPLVSDFRRTATAMDAKAAVVMDGP